MSRTYINAHKTGKLKKIQKIRQKRKKTLKKDPNGTLKRSTTGTPKRTLKKKKTKRVKGGNITDLWGRNLPVTSDSPLGDIVNGIKNPCLHGKSVF